MKTVKDKNVLLLEGDKYKAHLYTGIFVATLVIIVITALVRTTAILIQSFLDQGLVIKQLMTA